ncbi:adenylate kinase isoenzyme 1 isoform X2 [Neocloeon triangulifer]|uniref:adenylate kinase isoenzyme 1 isoform X2 n=1 Tax=Neocloeon triangulifer TaxID=2078957 RepID=UPI00286EC823|nr:adenylate kinase isoenzyme 1 isoform X2 [Neocloeon triangulifer]
MSLHLLGSAALLIFSAPRSHLALLTISTTKTEAHAVQIERKQIDTTPLKESGVPIIWVLGGPGSGKGTQCERIVAKYGFTHLSSGDLLRAEVASGSSRGQQLNATMELGELVPLEVVLDLLKEAMVSKLSESKGYLLDGYPREAAQGEQFEREVAPCSLVLFFNCTDATLTERLLKRGQSSGRVDDNEETIKKRLNTFHQHSRPVIQNYASKCKDINAERAPDEIFKDVEASIDALLAAKA